MTRILLHVGMTKTGSSAIQLLLARHKHELAARGLYYAALVEPDSVQDDRHVSGNGAELGRYLNPARRNPTFSQDRFERDFASRWLSDVHPHSLVSSEMMASAHTDMIARFRDHVAGDRPVQIVAVVRDFYAHARSAWMQLIKRHAYARGFADFCHGYRNAQVLALRRFEKVFPGAVAVLHFEPNRHDLFGAFLRGVGIEPDFAYRVPLINRSLAEAEIEVLAECNRRHGSPALSTHLSDHLLTKHPHREKVELWDPDLASLFEERFSADAAWVNRRYFGGAPTLTVAAPPASRPPHAPGPSAEEVWADVDEALRLRGLNLPG